MEINALAVAIDARKAKTGANEFNDAVTRMKTGAGQAGTAVRNLDSTTDAMGRTAERVRRTIAGLTAGFSAFMIIRSSINTMREFGDTMAMVRGVTGASAEEFKLLSDTARDLGATTRYTASQAGEGLLALSRAGFDVNEAIAAVPHSLNLALSAAIGLGEAADITASTIRQFELDATDAGRAVDVLTNTANRSNTTVAELAEGMKMAGPVANSLGLSLEETAAALGTMANMAVKGTMGGTNLRGILASLLGPTDEAAQSLMDLGFNAAQAEQFIGEGGLAGVFQILHDNAMTTTEAFADFNNRNAVGATILSGSVDVLKDLTQANRDARGAAEDMATTMSDTLGGSIYSLSSALSEVVLSIGESGLGSALRVTIDLATDTTRVLLGMEGKITGNAIAAHALANALKLVAMGFVINSIAKIPAMFIALGGAIKAASLAVNAFSFALMSSPLSVFAVAAAAIGYVLWDITDGFGSASNAADSMNDVVNRSTESIRLNNDALKISYNLRTAITDIDRRNALQSLRSNIQQVEEGYGIRPDNVSTDFQSFMNYRNDLQRSIEDASISDFLSNQQQSNGVDQAWTAAHSAHMAAMNESLVSSTILEGAFAEYAETAGINFHETINSLGITEKQFYTNAEAARVMADYVRQVDVQLAELDSGISIENENTTRLARLEQDAIDARAALDQLLPSLRLESELIGQTDEQQALIQFRREFATLTEQAHINSIQELADMAQLSTAIEDQIHANYQAKNAVEALADAQRLAIELQRKQDQSMELVDRSFETLRTELSLIGLTNNERERAIALETMKANAVDAGMTSDEIAAKTAEYKAMLDTLQSARELETIADGIGNSFADAFTQMTTGAESASEAIMSLANSVYRLMMNELIAQPLASALSGSVQGIANSKIWTTKSWAPSNAVGGVYANGTIQPYASGGVIDFPTFFPMSGGSSGLMGERGPEAIMPLTRDSSGRLGVHALDQPSAPPDVNVQVNVVNNSSQPVQAETGQAQFDGKNYIVSVVVSDLQRNGPIRQTMKGLGNG